MPLLAHDDHDRVRRLHGVGGVVGAAELAGGLWGTGERHQGVPVGGQRRGQERYPVRGIGDGVTVTIASLATAGWATRTWVPATARSMPAMTCPLVVPSFIRPR